MAADRTEMHNLAGQQPERLAAMVRQWETWAHRTGVLPWIWKPAYGQPDDSAGSSTPARIKKKAPKR